jgi:excisionase family DNA binding protein
MSASTPAAAPPLRVAYVARALGVSTSTVRRMIRDGELEAFKTRNRINSPLRITQASFDAYVERNRP